MKVCTQCGCIMSDDNGFCSRCGSSNLREASQDEVRNIQQRPQGQPQGFNGQRPQAQLNGQPIDFNNQRPQMQRPQGPQGQPQGQRPQMQRPQGQGPQGPQGMNRPMNNPNMQRPQGQWQGQAGQGMNRPAGNMNRPSGNPGNPGNPQMRRPSQYDNSQQFGNPQQMQRPANNGNMQRPMNNQGQPNTGYMENPADQFNMQPEIAETGKKKKFGFGKKSPKAPKEPKAPKTLVFDTENNENLAPEYGEVGTIVSFKEWIRFYLLMMIPLYNFYMIVITLKGSPKIHKSITNSARALCIIYLVMVVIMLIFNLLILSSLQYLM